MSVMELASDEVSVRELREGLADVLNAAGTRGQVTFVTSRGRRVAAVVSVAAGEQAIVDDQADEDAGLAVMYAVNLEMLLARGGTPDLTPAECFEDYAGAMLKDLGGSADRALACARAVIAESSGKAGYPMLWRQVALAVELCQRAIELTGRALPGSYRPGPGRFAVARVQKLGAD
jgi:prevent-host-death family protein